MTYCSLFESILINILFEIITILSPLTSKSSQLNDVQTTIIYYARWERVKH